MGTQNKSMIRLKGRLSQSSNALKRLLKGEMTQRFARFRIVRKTYSFFRRIIQHLSSNSDLNFNSNSHSNFSLKFNLTEPVNCSKSEQIVEKVLPINQVIQEVDETAVSFAFQLSETIVQKIHQYALEAPCIEPGYDKLFKVADLDATNCLLDGHQALRALVEDLNECPEIDAIAQDPFLLEIAYQYLRYKPTQITCHLSWSLFSQFPDQEIKRRYPAANYHYDIAGYNFATSYFYITPVLDGESGPHMMIPGSHRKKPLRMLFTSGRQSDEAIYSYYGKDQEIEIQGEPGFGFFQDPSCFHKVKAPTRRNRLLLQVRYS